MNALAISTLLIAIVVSISCALMGVFLVLRRMSMMVDAISHTVLLGIVLAYSIVLDLSSPWLLVGATIMGVLTVVLIELLVSTKRVSEDGATGTVFPLLFSIAVILITTRFSSTHLDTHAISGNLEFAAFEQLTLFGYEIGSKTLWTSGIVLLVLILIIVVLYKEFKITIFDSALAKTLGMAPLFIHYLMMTMVSLTAVTSFNAVGAILVVAMMIGPAASSLLITKRLSTALILAALLGSVNATVGYFVAMVVFGGMVNIASTITVVTFITFMLVWILEPNKGLVALIRRRRLQRNDIESLALMTHMASHEVSVYSHDDLIQQLNWSSSQLRNHLYKEMKRGFLTFENDTIVITQKGYEHYQVLLKEYSNEV